MFLISLWCEASCKCQNVCWSIGRKVCHFLVDDRRQRGYEKTVTWKIDLKLSDNNYFHCCYFNFLGLFQYDANSAGSGVVARTCNPVTFEAQFQNSVGSIPVGVNSPSMDGRIVWPPVIQCKERNQTKYWNLTVT